MLYVIPFAIMKLLKEMKNCGLHINSTKARVQCRVFEDNSEDLEISCINKYQTHTEQLNNIIHHFRSYMDTKEDINIHLTNTKDKPTDMLNKALTMELLIKFIKMIMGW